MAQIYDVEGELEKLGYDFIDGQDEIRVPQNIAGSAVNPSQGGRPEEENNDE